MKPAPLAVAATVATSCLIAAPRGNAAVITHNLTAPGAGVIIDGAIFQQSAFQPAGSGVINSFLRVQNTGVEHGYNTDETTSPPQPHIPLDGKSGVSKNNGDISVSDLAATLVTIGTTSYYAFALDMDEAIGGTDSQGNPERLLTLDSFQIYTSPTHHQVTESFLLNGDVDFAGGVKRYDIDANADHAILLDESTVKGGSGKFDMVALVPTSYLNGVAPTDAFYLYTKFGLADGASSSFEEWGLAEGFDFTDIIPEPGSLGVLGLLTASLAVRRRR
jgi:hypothetical protein